MKNLEDNFISLDDISQAEERTEDSVAIIGMACKFPYGEEPEEFFENIAEGNCFVRKFDGQRKQDIDEYLKCAFPNLPEEIQYFDGSYLEEIDKFDYKFFHMTPKEAELLEPSHRLFLENTVKAIEDAGYGGDRLKGSDTSIFIGYSGSIKDSYENMILNAATEDVPLSIANNMDGMLGGRIAYLYDLRGVSELIDTACASSLVAVHSACQSILDGESTMAIAGSVRLQLVPIDSELSRVGVEAPDYMTRSFDENGEGFGLGEGVVTLILKSLKAAEMDGDNIYAVIKGSAVNQGGSSMGLTVTNPDALSDVIRRAWEKSGISPEDIELLETHGTATNLGDPIELKGVTDAFLRYTDKKGFCAVGSVKSNMGHLYEASGMAGLLKAILALRYKKLPASLYFNTPNSSIDFVGSPLYVNVKTRDWDTSKDKRRAAVNSLGLCGTNSHIVLEEFVMPPKKTEDNTKEHMILLSAKSETALENLCKAYKKFIGKSTAELGNICYTSAVGRWHYSYRLAIRFQTKEELEEKIGLVLEHGLEKIEDKSVFYGKNEDSKIESEEYCDVRKQDINKICELYVTGKNINWQQYYQNSGCQIEHIPTYQFDKERCWIEIERPDSLEDCFTYQITWHEKEPVKKKASICKLLLVGQDTSELEPYQKSLETLGVQVTCMQAETLVNSETEAFSNVVFVTSSKDNVAGQGNSEKLEEMYAGLNLFVKLFQKQKWDYIGLVTSNVNKVINDETVFVKENAPYIALLQAIGKENADIKIKIIDKEQQTSSQVVAEELLEEEESYVAYRAGKRYISNFSEASLEGKSPIVLADEDCYLVTGGLGEIALEVCHRISERVHATFLLISRRKLPERSEWDNTVHSDLAAIFSKIKEIEAKGSKVVIQSADVGTEAAIKQAVDKFQETHGEIVGVIHCAGMSDNTVMNQLDVDTLQKVMEPKARGLVNCYQILKNQPKFYLLFSSIATTFTAPMQGAYIAANAYLDAAAEELKLQGANVLVINWTTWKEIGMAAKNNLAKDLIFEALPTQEALNMLEQVLEKHDGSRVIIGKLNCTKLGANLLLNAKVPLSKKIKEFAQAYKEDKAVSNKSSQSTPKVMLTGKDEEKESYTEIEKTVAGICRKVLGYKTVNVYENFFEMGADSLQVMNIHKEIEKIYPQKLELTDMFNYSSIAKVAEFLQQGEDAGEKIPESLPAKDTNIQAESDDIAIIGVAAKLPKAETLDDVFDNLMEGQCVIDELPTWRKDYLTEYMKFKKMDTSKVSFTRGGYLEDIDKFDYEFFHLSPKEAMLIDPHQRIYMELALTAMEDAGYGAEKMKGTNTGVFLGFGTNLRDMYERLIYDVCPEGVVDSVVGNTDAVMAGRISHAFHLKGPSMVINTACSSSLTALDTAVNFVKSGCIDMALVGGIKLILMPVEDGNLLMKIGMESSDGYTRTFDDSSDGTAFSEGGEMILIKPLRKAVQDGDHIYGVIKGIAINQDGNSSSITAPNPEAQTEVIVKAWNDAKIQPEKINYVEVHGTGTQLGDTIEYKSLDRAFRRYTDKKAFCVVNSIKPNYGHLSEGSGLFGLLKGLMALQKEYIPKNILFQNPNRKINMIDSAMYVNTRNLPWNKKDEELRTFAVSNFGMSGTNVHLVVQEYKEKREVEMLNKEQIVTFSNKTSEGLQRTIHKMLRFIQKNEVSLGDLSYTLNTGRGHYEYRLAVICSSIEELNRSLQYYLANNSCDEQSFAGFVQVISDDRPKMHEYEKYNSEILALAENAKEFVAKGQLKEISKAYVDGAKINWSDLYQDNTYRHISLPTYEFTKQSCFVTIPKSDRDIDEDSLFYEVKWKEKEKASKLPVNKQILVFMVEDNTISNKIVEALKKENNVVIVTDKDITATYHTEMDYEALLKRDELRALDYILNLNTLADLEPEKMEELGVILMLRLCKGIVQANLSRKLKLITVTQNLWEVTGEEAEHKALGAAAVGLNRVIGLEMPKVTSHSIDIDTTCSVEAILSELEEEKNYYETSLRNDHCFIPEFDVSEMNEMDLTTYEAKSDGVYVITGGTGGIGLVLAKQLTASNPLIHITLLCRSERYKNDQKCMDSIEALRKNGAIVEVVIADVAESRQVYDVFEKLKKQYGHINGVIHAAGTASAEILATRSEEKLKEVLAPKYYGSLHILQEIEQEKVDFFVLCSSGCTLTGEMSQGDYVAANTFLDAFTYMANSKGVKTHCINWVSWKTEGMSVRYQINVDETFKALVNEDAMYAFNKIIASSNKKCLVGKLNYPLLKRENYNIEQMPLKLTDRIANYISEAGAEKKDIEFVPLKTKQAKGQNQQVIVEGLEGEESYKDIEIEIAQIFGNVLGRERINVYDNFFECGGDSVLLTRLHEAIQQKYPDKLKLMDLFTYTSAKKIAAYIHTENETIEVQEEETGEGLSDENLDDLMQQFEQGELSEEDMIKILKGTGGGVN